MYSPAEPRTPEEVVRDATETNNLDGHVALAIEDFFDGDVFAVDVLEGLNDAVSLAMTGSEVGLLDITTTPVGVTDDHLIVFEVSGEVRMEEFEWPEQ